MTRYSLPAVAPVIWVNWGLWSLGGAMLLVMTTLVAYWRLQDYFAHVEPAPVPEVAVVSVKGLALPEMSRNPFDPDGQPWLSNPETAAKVSQDKIVGVSTVPGMKGVFTPTGFVALGQPFARGILAEVGDGKVVVTLPDGQKETMEIGKTDESLKSRLQLDRLPRK
jgi:hypothetical protein